MNNKVFIAADVRNEAVLDAMRVRLEGEDFFDRYGDASLSERYEHFGFATVAPAKRNGKTRYFWRLLGCSYVYMPCGWHGDKCGRRSMMWAELLGKVVIFEEDARCR